jgi:xanthine/uracil permease
LNCFNRSSGMSNVVWVIFCCRPPATICFQKLPRTTTTDTRASIVVAAIETVTVGAVPKIGASVYAIPTLQV